MNACLSCGHDLAGATVFCDLGHQPLANALLRHDDLDRPEMTYPLRPVVCDACTLVQLPACPHADTIFTDDYPFYSGQSAAWVDHCRAFVSDCINRLGIHRESRILEIGSNDGTLLKAFAAAGIPATGVEPCEEVARYALRSGAASYITPWGMELALHLASDGWRADLVVADNVLAHVEDLRGFLRATAHILAPGGTAVFEVPYVADMIRDGAYDQVYAEHRCYFSLRSISRALSAAGLLVWGVRALDVHGGSLRVYARPEAGQAPGCDRPDDVRPSDEIAAGLREMDTYLAFAQRPVASKQQAMWEMSQVLRSHERPRVAGYGASAKATVTLNWLGWGPEVVPFTVDTTPAKQGLYLPGVHVPVLHPGEVDGADVVLNFLWNWREQSERNIRMLWPDVQIIYPHDF